MFDLNNMSYKIKEELLIRKKLEKHTDFDIEFNENYEDKYDYDLLYCYHKQNNSDVGYEKQKLGYVEIEVSPRWKNYNVPSCWYEISFLKRKIFSYDFSKNIWSKELKPGAKNTIYLKFNKPLTNCFAMPIVEIVQLGKESSRSDNSYKNSFISVSKNKITFGLENCIELINNFFIKDKDKKNVSSWFE